MSGNADVKGQVGESRALDRHRATPRWRLAPV